MKILESSNANFKVEFDKLINRSNLDVDSVTPSVMSIIKDVKQRGDIALKEQISKFDHWDAKEGFLISKEEMKEAYDRCDKKLLDTINLAAARIEAFHQKQLEKSWIEFESNGNILGQKITPLSSAGLYVPGGKAAYPSSLLMNYIPAKVAGVKEIAVCTPAVNGEINSLLLAALHLLGVKKAYKVGGASAIAAMAYGTKTISKVDVITGPGNIFVATAKKLVFGDVNIDMIAGPSEIGILADSSMDPKITAIDLLSQAEHDEMASSFLITDDKTFANSVKEMIYKELETLKREPIARKSIENRGAIVVAKDRFEAIELMNKLAVEHLEICFDDAMSYLPLIKNAGAIFLGKNTPEAMGDYVAGPNHTLPTGGSAKFFSPLGVYNFIKRSSIIHISDRGFDELSAACMSLADIEGLEAHKLSVKKRKK